jgi:hypothetical protein
MPLHSQWVMVQDGPPTGPGAPSATLKFSIGDCSCNVPIAGVRYESVVYAYRISSQQTIQIAAQDAAVCGSTAPVVLKLLPDPDCMRTQLQGCTFLHMSAGGRGWMFTESPQMSVWAAGVELKC